ncbi:hypothetical protein LINGRAHAP2_LOCUS29669, partial [Linum grandiflorum]
GHSKLSAYNENTKDSKFTVVINRFCSLTNYVLFRYQHLQEMSIEGDDSEKRRKRHQLQRSQRLARRVLTALQSKPRCLTRRQSLPLALLLLLPKRLMERRAATPIPLTLL